MKPNNHDIKPCLWFDNQGKDAEEFFFSLPSPCLGAVRYLTISCECVTKLPARRQPFMYTLCRRGLGNEKQERLSKHSVLTFHIRDIVDIFSPC
ncbi:MAG: hypothetical protein IPG02_11965 [Ignavibacteria bacterium]|nr:hypothetical protein [Ignavibacteria bacterium]